MIQKASRLFLVALVILSLAAAFGCRSRAQTAEPVPDPVPVVVEPPPPPPEVEVTPPEDFVQEPEPVAEDLSGSSAELTERALNLGWIRDAFFEFDSFALSADAQDALAVTAAWMRTHPDVALMIEGHADERGTQQYNLALAERRANIARDYLITLGVDPVRITTISYGEERPFAFGSNEQAWAQNRRAHMVLTRR